MKIKELKEMIKDYDDEKDIVFISSSGVDWQIREVKQKEKPEQVVVYIK